MQKKLIAWFLIAVVFLFPLLSATGATISTVRSLEVHTTAQPIEAVIVFENQGPYALTLTIWYSDFNYVWDRIHTEHMPAGTQIHFGYQVGQLQYYGYSTDGGVTIYPINTNYIYL